MGRIHNILEFIDEMIAIVLFSILHFFAPFRTKGGQIKKHKERVNQYMRRIKQNKVK